MTPTPVSNFDFHEGAGTTATSLVGGYTLTDVSGWAGGGGITSSARGNIGTGAPTNWTVALDMILTWVVDGSFQQFILQPSNGSGYWLQVQNGWPQIWRGDALSAAPIALHSGVLCQLVYTVSPGRERIYIDGTQIAERANPAYGAPFDTSGITGVWGWGGTTPTGTLKRLRFYDTELTAAEVAAIDVLPPQSVLPAAIVSAEAIGVHTVTAAAVPVSVIAPTAIASAEAIGSSTVGVEWIPPPVVPPAGVETVLVRSSSTNRYDSNGNRILPGLPRELVPIEVEPGNGLLAFGIGGDLDTVAFTVYFELGTQIVDDDELEVRGRTCKARVSKWDSAGVGGLAVLAHSATGTSSR